MSLQITTLDGLAQAAQDHKSLCCPKLRGFDKPKPAAFVINYSGHILHRLIQSGLYIYEPKKKES